MSHPPSYWSATAGPEPPGVTRLDRDRTADVAVIGGGYTGLAAAYRLAQGHGLDTVVLEAEEIGWGASGRNGGFAMPGMGKVPLGDRIARWGVEAARRSVQMSIESVTAVRELIEKESVDCEPQAPGWVNVAHGTRMLAVLEEKRDLYQKLGYDDVELLDRSALEARGYLRGPSAHGALRFGAAFGLHPLKYARGLAAATARRGVALCARSPVVAWSKADGWHVLATPAGTVRARRVVVATNGYTSDRLHAYFAGRTLSAASNIIVTRRLTPDEWEAVGMRTTQVYSDTRSLLFYWRRLPDDRLLYGGRGGIIETPRALAGRRAWLEAAVAKRFPVLQGIGSEYFWWGKVCLPYDVTPHVNTIDADGTVAYALGYTGTGVAMATFCGGLAADLVAGREIPRDTPLTSRGLARFPFAALRRLYLAAAYAVYRVKDRG